MKFIFGKLIRKALSLNNLGILFMSVFALSNQAHAKEIIVALHEKATNETTAYAVDLNALELRKVNEISGNEARGTDLYSVSNQKLAASGKAITDANEILYQGQLDGFDFLVIRQEYNSFSNPMRWLSALSGHPVQVNKILALKIKDGNVISQREIVEKASSYHWSAQVFSKVAPATSTTPQ